MRVSLLLLFIVIAQLHAENLYSQSTVINLSLRNVTVEQVLDRIEKDTEFSFLFTDKSVDTDRIVDMNIHSKNINETLKILFGGTDVSYRIVDRQVILSKKKEGTDGINQSKQVTGVIKDANGESVIGANVVEKGTNNGTISDIDGKFSLNVAPGATLMITYIGYVSQEIKVDNRNSFSIVLKEDSEMLEEVVVGYGTMKKKDLTGAVAKVNMEDLLKTPSSSFDQTLGGRIAGVNVSSGEGMPGGTMNIVIRGNNSLTQDNSPLYVIDGFPVEDPTIAATINPSDVESVDVLKDASATAIYGTRGANGVIMITTKNGGKGKAKVNFSANYALQFNSNKIDVADAGLFASAVRSAVKNDGIAMTNLAYGEDYIGRLNSIDWQDEMSRTALQQNYNLSASGGSENTQANLSLGYLNNQGIVIESNFKRLTARANITHKVKDFLHVGLNLNYAHSEKMGGGNLRNYAQAIPTMDYVEDGVFYSMPIVLPDGTWGHYKKEGNGDVNKGADNLVAAAKTADSINKWDRLLASAFLQLDLYKGLTFKTIASYNYYTKGYNGYTAYNDRTFGTQDRKDSFSLNQSQSTSLGLEAFLNYDWSNEHHRVSAMAGFSTSDTNGAWLNSSANDFPADNIRKISLTNDPSSKQTDGGLDLKTRFLSYFGRLTYTLNDRYIVTATVRRDGSSNFGAGNRYGTFPSASVAWRLSEEKFIKDLELFSNLKLRAGWGQTGNAGNGTNLSIAQLSSANAMYWFFNGSSVINGAGIAQQKEIDTNLKWETNEQTNIGIDFAFMNNELSFSADYFIRDAKDLLLYRQIRPSTGFSNVYTNAGHIRNSGFEFTAAWNKSFSDWNIGIRLNGSTLKNEAIEVGDPIFSKSGSAQDGDNWDNHSITQNGYPVGSYYGWKVEGIFRTQAEIDEMNRLAVEKGVESGVYQDKTTQPGDYKFVDLNGDGQITDADRTVIGNGYPKFTYGMNLTASWKNFDFSMNLYGVAGMDILSYSSARLTSVYAPDGGYQNVLKEYINNAWSSSNTGAKYPRITKTDYNKNMRVSDAYIQKGDYLKISNIQIGYTFPKNVLKPVKMENARVFASVDNVCTISSYNKFGDPEVGDSNVLYSGFDGGRYPFPMSVTFGLSVQF